MLFNFRTNFLVGSDVYRFGATDGTAVGPEPDPDTGLDVMRAVMQPVMRSPMAVVMAPSLRAKEY